MLPHRQRPIVAGGAAPVAVWTVLLGLTACALLRDAGGQTGSMSEARRTYMRACASCHGETARGDGPVAAELLPRVPDLTTLAVRHSGVFPREDVIDVIAGEREIRAHGTREMPVWSQRFGPNGVTAAASIYARRRLELLASYLESLQRSE